MTTENVRPVTLPEVVERTLAAVVAKPLGEAKTTITVGSSLPPFVRVDGKWEVTEVLADGTATLKPGAKIVVHAADAALRLRVHRELHRSGTARQFLTHRYEPTDAPAGKKPRILFLRMGDGPGWPEWAYVVHGAVEGLDAMADVRAALAAKFPSVAKAKAPPAKKKPRKR